MCPLQEDGKEPIGKDRREFCRLGGNLALGMIALTSVSVMVSKVA